MKSGIERLRRLRCRLYSRRCCNRRRHRRHRRRLCERRRSFTPLPPPRFLDRFCSHKVKWNQTNA